MPVLLHRVFSVALCAALAIGTLVGLAPLAKAGTPTTEAPHATPLAQQQQEFNVLVFSKTAGYRHGSIPEGISAIKQLGQEHNFGVTATEDAGAFTYDNLTQYKAVIWLSTTGNVLNQQQQAAFESYIKGGGGYVGIHAAADTEYDWPFYGKLVGAYFDSHPAIQEADVKVTDRVHPSTKDLPKTWTRTDEWYNYASNPRGDVHVLATLDESSYNAGGGAMGVDHPISWCQSDLGGPSWYTGMGHTSGSYSNPQFLDHILGGIQTAAGAVEADCGATNWSNFDQVALAKGPDQVGEPMGMAVLPNGDVLHSERQGTLYYTTAEGTTSVAAEVPVYTHDEEGLQSIALDPNFSQNRWVYVYYAPPLDTPSGDAPESADDPSVFDKWKGYNQLSRFKLDGTKLDLSSEQKILQVDASRGMCCHVGGDITFGPQGKLWLSTGDDTNPFQSSGYTPIDERENRYAAFDAQRTSADTNDLRGKVLRIDVGSGGSYTIPDGNMFAGDGSAKTRPEIYAMGFRNPYRISVSEQGVLYVGNYGPDAGQADPQRGPAGIVEFDRITEPGFYGWPYCVGENIPYHDYDFATGESGPEFDCTGGPANDSPNNDGLIQLPSAKPAWLPYNGNSVAEFGSGSESPMGGPVYNYDADSTSNAKLPAYYDGKFFAYEWGRGWIKPITIGAEGQPLAIDPFFPSMELTRPMDIEFGSNGALYVLDYGSGYFGGAEDSALYRIEYVKGDRAPNAKIAAEPTSGRAPLEVQFSSEGSGDPDPGSSITYAWDFDGDGQTDSTASNPTHTYTEIGEYQATLTVTDKTGKSGTASETIVVGNTEPDVTIRIPKDGQVFGFGDTIDYTVTVNDPDGTQVDCSNVEVEYVLGHSTGSGFHGHPLSEASGCQGTIETANTSGHQGADIHGVLHATYTDTPPSEGVPPVTGEEEIILQPKHRQAEYFADSSGVQTVDNGGAQAGTRVGYIEPGDWISFTPYNLAGVESAMFRISSGGPGGTIEIHAGSPDGELVATVDVPNTGGYSNYQQVGPVPVTDPGGTSELFFVFEGSGSGGLFDIDAFTFRGTGAGTPLCDNPDAEVNPDTEFSGDEFNHCRWRTIVRRDAQHYRVADRQLRIDALPGDMYGDTTNAKNIVLQDAPNGGWQAVTKLELPLDGSDPYEQAGLMVYGNDANFAKAVLIDVPNLGLRFEFAANVNGEARFNDSVDRSGQLPDGIENGAWIKVISDGNAVTAHWSADGEAWHPFGRARSLSSIEEPKVGLAAFHGTGQTASFDFFHMGDVQRTCQPTQPEEGYSSLYNGTAASLQDWAQAGPGGFMYTVNCTLQSYGGLGLLSYKGEKFQAPYSLKLDWRKPGDDNSGVFVGFPDPKGDPWSAVNQGEEVQIDPTDDPANRTGAVYNEQAPNLEKVQQALKPDGEWNTYNIVVKAKSITVYLNGVKVNHWVDDDPNVDLSEGYIGVQNHGGTDRVFFRNIRVKKDIMAPKASASLDPPEPNGDPVGRYEGTYHTPVTVTLEASDGGSGVAAVEYRRDGGDWTTYTGPVTVAAAGEHTVAYRATDQAGNTSKVDTVSFEIVPDACPGSDIRDAVIIDGADTGVDNVDRGDGCTVNDLIDADASYDNHGAFVDHVDQVTSQLVADGVISDKEKGRIMRAAGRSDIGA